MQVHALATRIFDPSTYIGVETAKFRATIPNNRDDIRSFIPAFVDAMDAVHGCQHNCVYVRAEEKFNPTTGTFTDEETGWIRFILTSTGKTSTSSIPNHPIMPRSIVYTAHGLPRILHGSRCPAQGSSFVPRTDEKYSNKEEATGGTGRGCSDVTHTHTHTHTHAHTHTHTHTHTAHPRAPGLAL